MGSGTGYSGYPQTDNKVHRFATDDDVREGAGGTLAEHLSIVSLKP